MNIIFYHLRRKLTVLKYNRIVYFRVLTETGMPLKHGQKNKFAFRDSSSLNWILHFKNSYNFYYFVTQQHKRPFQTVRGFIGSLSATF